MSIQLELRPMENAAGQHEPMQLWIIGQKGSMAHKCPCKHEALPDVADGATFFQSFTSPDFAAVVASYYNVPTDEILQKTFDECMSIAAGCKNDYLVVIYELDYDVKPNIVKADSWKVTT